MKVDELLALLYKLDYEYKQFYSDVYCFVSCDIVLCPHDCKKHFIEKKCKQNVKIPALND